MLQENPQRRPNIYQVVVEVCSMRHRAVPIKDVRFFTNYLPLILTTLDLLQSYPL